MRQEFPLNLLNFIRDQTERYSYRHVIHFKKDWQHNTKTISRVLSASQACGQTPSKINTPSKYNFPSPVKALQSKRNNSERRGGRKGTQLVFDSGKKSDLEVLSRDKMKHLEDRFGTPTSQPKSLNLKSVGSKSAGGSGGKNHKSARRSLEGNLSDYIIDKPKQNKKNKKGRRSDPIVVQQLETHKPSSSDELENDKKKIVTTPIAIKKGPLAKLTPEMKTQFDKSHVWDSIVLTMDKSPAKSISNNVTEFIEPMVEKVTLGEKIERLAILYSECIRLHMVPNILMEFYLLFQLLTVKENLTDNPMVEDSTITLLGSVHNCVYFAIKVLNQQVDFLEHLDRATLASLAQNQCIKSFCSAFQNKLEDILSTKRNRQSSGTPDGRLISSVRLNIGQVSL